MTNKLLVSTPVKKQTMAEQMAEKITDLILKGVLESNENLPIEPELAAQFGVSRAVVRDATRILMAKGLVDVKHGKGVFVTEPNNPTFGDALLLALQRAKATAWDVQEFEIYLYPEILALAAINATDEDIEALEKQANECIAFVENYYKRFENKTPTKNDQEEFRLTFQKFSVKLFACTHNKVMEQLAIPFLNLRNLRDWKDSDALSIQDYVKVERQVFDWLINTVKTRDPIKARKMGRESIMLPIEAISAMKKTPVGEIIKIDVSLPKDFSYKTKK
jgi:GntR family transcriptional regulator, transcriptional repressor for pyruvate dehydrogenase complex